MSALTMTENAQTVFYTGVVYYERGIMMGRENETVKLGVEV